MKIVGVKNFLKLTLLFFLLLNTLGLGFKVATLTIGHPYPVAKIPLATAEFINSTYIVPIDSRIGPYNPAIRPLYSLRDYLFNLGIQHIPLKDAEREYWWVQIKGINIVTIGQMAQERYVFGQDTSAENINIIKRDMNDLNSHIIKASKNVEMKDKELERSRLSKYTLMTYYYIFSAPAIFDKLSNVSSFEDPDSFFFSQTEYEKMLGVLYSYSTLRGYALKKNPEELNYLNKNWRWYQDIALAFGAASYILGSEILNQRFSCKNELIKLYFITDQGLKKKVLNNPDIYKENREFLKLFIDSDYNQKVLSTVSRC